MNVPHWKNFIECIKIARQADQRHRNLRPLFDGLHSGQPLDAPQNVARLGREELDREAKPRQTIPESEVSFAVEA